MDRISGVRLVSPAVATTEIKRDLAKLASFLAPTYLLKRSENQWILDSSMPIPRAVVRRPIAREIQNVQAILILGSNDLAPPRQAAGLYRQIAPHNPSVKLIASGKGGHLTIPAPAFSVTEAERYWQELVAHGVPRENILVEPTSTNTGQNITFSQSILRAMGFAPARFIIIQTGALQLRANLVFERQWEGDWEYYISSPPGFPDTSAMSYEDADFYLASVLREMMTWIGYSYDPQCNFQTKRAIPKGLIDIMLKYYNSSNEQHERLYRQDFMRNIKPITRFFRERFQDAEKAWLDK